MTGARGLVPAVVVVALLALPGVANGATVQGIERSALAKLKKAPVDAPTKTAARAQIARAAHLIRTLPNGRSYHVLVALRETASFPGAVTQPRALALYGALRANNDYFAAHWAPRDKTDIVGADGVVYRYFGGHSFRFHPLANFGVLNARATAGDVEGTQELADALIARGVYQQGGGIAWEYDFPFGGGRAPWLSGMAQAVAAQAFARAAQAVPERATDYLREATAAFRIVPRRLLTSVSAGPWIRLYSFSKLPVLNAQLQAVVSLQSYAAATGDTQAATLATRMQNLTAATLSRFDTGYWSYYALPNEPSPPDYHRYVVQLLNRLKSADPRFAAAATRFAGYEKQPPAFQLANAGVGQVRFWLSKPATVVADTAAGPSKRLALLDGWHTLTWKPKRTGVYSVHLTATDWNGNRTQLDTLPIVRVGKGSFAKVTPANVGDQGAPPFVVANRAAVTWPDAATVPDPAVVASLAALPAPLFLELDTATTPTTAFAQYAAALAQQLPSLGYLVVGPAPSAATAAQYAATVAAVRNAVHAVLPTLAVGMTLDGAVAPKATVTALGRAGATADVVALRAAPATTGGQWTQPNIDQLTQAFGGVPPPLVLDSPTAAAVSAAACSPGIAGIALDPATRDAATATALASLARGITVCPGFAVAPTLPTVEFPTTVTSGTSAALQLACVRDCLYVATLVGADGRPVVARRGSLKGGTAPAAVALPKTQLGQPSYTLDLRVVSTVNPGSIVELASPPLTRAG
ncbi:MAG TPA: D-glucuronyl C5-epimerase family protein [Gaiellaceae bacterium]|nr:D-glucuronyl C5-epimerase family protein [Gaiellaceae bacterium]